MRYRLLLLLPLTLVAAGLLSLVERGAEVAAPTALAAPAPETGTERALRHIDEAIAFHGARAVRTGSWMDEAQVARGHLSRAHLSGSYEDYGRAAEALERAFSKARPGTGPFLLRARLSFAMHRFDAVETDLVAATSGAVVPRGTRAAAAEMRADLALHAGRYEEAHAAYLDAVERSPSMTAYARLAHYQWKTGDFEGAEASHALAARAAIRGSGEGRAWLELQRGLMDLDRGRFADALGHYRRADAELPGWYLVEEHMAEALYELGEVDRARALYEDVVARTGDPELMAALAGVVEAQGDADRARELMTEARRRHEDRLARFPTAAYGHALEFFLEHGPVERALELAERNHAARPSGEAKVQLAQAYLAAGRTDDAAGLLDAVIASPFDDASLHATAAVLHARRGDAARAAAERLRAEAIDPGAMGGVAFLR